MSKEFDDTQRDITSNHVSVNVTRAPDVDRKQDAAPDPTGPVMTYEARRDAIRTFIAEGDAVEVKRTPEETEALIDAHMAREHLPGPVPEGKLFTVAQYGADGKEMHGKAFAPMTHADAIAKCHELNEGADGSTWWGVTHAAEEK